MLDLATETFALPIWAAALIAGSFAVAVLFAFTKPSDVVRTALRAGLAFVATVLVTWIALDRSAAFDRLAERRALDSRAADLTARAIAPGSPLACLDAISGDVVESACERALFTSPEATAAAVSYISARLDLLAQGVAFAATRDPEYGAAISALRQGLENDRFGFVAQVLSLRDSCTAAQCDTFALFSDTSRVRANLKDRAFDSYVTRYAANWSTHDARLTALSTDTQPVQTGSVSTSTNPGITGSIGLLPSGVIAAVPITTATTPARPAGALSHYDFPSANSIPAVSIMTPESDSASPPLANTPMPQRKPAAAVRAATSPPRPTQSSTGSAPVQLVPAQPSMVEPGHSFQ